MILTKKIVFISMDHPTIIHIEVRCNKARLAYHVEIKRTKRKIAVLQQSFFLYAFASFIFFQSAQNIAADLRFREAVDLVWSISFCGYEISRRIICPVYNCLIYHDPAVFVFCIGIDFFFGISLLCACCSAVYRDITARG